MTEGADDKEECRKYNKAERVLGFVFRGVLFCALGG